MSAAAKTDPAPRQQTRRHPAHNRRLRAHPANIADTSVRRVVRTNPPARAKPSHPAAPRAATGWIELRCWIVWSLLVRTPISPKSATYQLCILSSNRYSLYLSQVENPSATLNGLPLRRHIQTILARAEFCHERIVDDVFSNAVKRFRAADEMVELVRLP